MKGLTIARKLQIKLNQVSPQIKTPQGGMDEVNPARKELQTELFRGSRALAAFSWPRLMPYGEPQIARLLSQSTRRAFHGLRNLSHRRFCL
jgi:hypothetical protein